MTAADPGARGLRPVLTDFFDPAANEQSGDELSRAVSLVLTTALVITNLIGAGAVLAVTYLILPLPPVPDAAQVRSLNAIVAGAYIVLAVIAGATGGRALLGGLSRWLRGDQPASRSVQHLVVRGPLFLFRLQVGLWLTAAVVFGVIDAVHSVRLGLVIAATVALTVIPIIHRHGGRIDKFVGDGLLAVFGTPRRLDNHADAGLAAATEIMAALGDEDAGPLEVGIGLNSGRVVAGNLGGTGRLEYGVIGDPVNVAARVQAHTRETGDTLLLTEDARERLSREPDGLRRRDGVTLRGRSEPSALYAL